MKRDNNKYDEVLGQRLSETLARTADSAQVPPDAWARFQERESAVGAVINGAEAEVTEPISMTKPRAGRRHPWRAPLIAAAAVVVVVAVAATAAATGAFSRGDTVASPAIEGQSTSDPVAVPVYCRADHGGPAAPQLATLTASAVEASPCAANPTAVQLSFVDGKGTQRDLRGALDLGKGRLISGVIGSDGTPLGYLSAARPGATVGAAASAAAGTSAGPDSDFAVTLWGAARTEVAQLLVTLSASPLLPGGAANPAFDGAEVENWRFVSTDPTTPIGKYHQAPLTEIAGGYRGFALRVPSVFTLVDLTALDAGGRVLQDRAMDLVTGTVSDPSTPATTPEQSANTTTLSTAPNVSTPLPTTTAPAGTTSPGYNPALDGTGVTASGAPNQSAPVRVPINTSYEIVGDSVNGVSPNPPYSGPPPGGPPAYGLAAIQMSFVGGAPPTATLRGLYVRDTGALTTNNMDQASDGAPLGYVTSELALTTGGTASTTTLWGAVGPEVAKLQIVSDFPATVPPGHELRARWIFTVDAAGTRPAGSGNAGDLTQFPQIAGGYHGFAVQLPGAPAPFTLTAIGRNGQTLQSGQFGPTAGTEVRDSSSIGGPPPTGG